MATENVALGHNSGPSTMKTFRLQIGALDGAQDAYPMALVDHVGNTTLAQELLARKDVGDAHWSPAKIPARFQGATHPTSDLEQIGKQLGAWATAGTVGARLTALRAERFRLLLDVQDPVLAELPWELMRSGGLPDFL